MIRNRLGTLLVATILLGACGGDDRTGGDGDTDGAVIAPGMDSGAGQLDGSMDGSPSNPDIDATIILPDGAVVLVPGATGDSGRPFAFDDAGRVLCGNTTCQCSDGIDQDMDGLIDQQDPECISPWDNDESSFATGISGDNRDEACQDCFFDGNSGSGNDGCRVATSCLRNQNDPSSGRGNCNTCTATDQCRTSCQAYTPNGCDCFGCCTVQLGSNITKSVALAPGCDINGTTLSAGCTECVPSTSCRNECGRCELCPGKTLADLPADCTPSVPQDAGTPDSGAPVDDSGIVAGSDAGADATTPPPPPPPPPPPTPTCDRGEPICGAGHPACGAGFICAFGCCILTPLL